MDNVNTLQITVLGNLQMRIGEGAPIRFAARRAATLVAYLALTRSTHSREALATMLWDDRTQKQSMANMRSLLAQMPKPIKPYILKSRDSLAINPDLPVVVDAAIFEEAITAKAFAEAVACYKGDFLAGITIRDSEGLETWLIVMRERLRQQASNARQALAENSLRQRHFAEGISHAEALIALDSLREGSYQTLMMLLARDGQRGRALQVYGQCRAMLAEEFGLEPLAKTTALAQRIRQMQDEPPFVVPHPAGTFIGRQQELTLATNSLDQRLITLIGPGGIGKTRLATAIATHARGLFWDGIYFIELANLADPTATPEMIASYIATHMGLTLQRTPSAQEQLLTHLADRELLLVLDNMEHLLPAGANLIHTLQQNNPQLTLLITTRQRLNLQAEHLIPLHGFPIPKLTHSQSSAILQLFQQAAQRTQPTFTFTSEEDRATALAICRLVEGSPLGIELATAWLPYYTLSHIHQAIAQNLDFITTRHSHIPTRHRSLRAVFQHSWTLLDPAEQTTLSHLAQFRGGFDLPAAQQIAAASPHHIFSLIDKSLIHAEGQDSPRFLLRDFIQQYALEKQDPAGQLTLAQTHANYYLQQLAQPTPTLRSELGNIQRAWQWTIENRPLTLLDHLNNLTRFYEVAGFFQEAQNNLQHAIDYVTERSLSRRMFDLLVKLYLYQAEFLSKQGQYPAGINAAQTAYQIANTPQDKISARLHLSRIAGFQGQHDQALTYAQECADYYEQTNTPQALAQALDIIGSVYTRQGNFDQAITVLQRVVSLDRQRGDEKELVGHLVHLGTAYMEITNYEEALRYHKEARDLAKQHNYQERLAQTSNNLGLVYWRIGQYQAALTAYQEGEQIAQQIGHQRGVALTNGNIGVIYKELGDFDKALASYNKAIAIAEEAGLRWEIARYIGNIGNLYKEQGDYESALPHLRQALAIDKALANTDGMARHLGNIGDIYRLYHQYNLALPYLDESVRLYRENGANYYLCTYLIIKAMTLFELGHITEAEQLNQEGLAIAKEVNRPHYIEKGEALAQKIAASSANVSA